MYTLTAGCVSRILDGEKPMPVTLQVLAVKPFPTGDRYKLLVSDSVYKSPMAVIASQHSHLVDSGKLTTNCVVEIKNYSTADAGSKKKIMVLLDFEVVSSSDYAGGVIGQPKTFEALQDNKENTASPAPTRKVSTFASTPTGKRPRQDDVKTPGGWPSIRPISALTPYQNKWTICGRITGKSSVRTWNKNNVEGKLFTFDVLDESAEIRVTAFGEQCDKFLDLIQINKVFFINGAQVKNANKRFSTLKNDYEISLNSNTQITECEDDAGLPTMAYDFVSLSELKSAKKYAVFDIMGVCHKVGEVGSITVKTTSQEIKKREVHVVDETNTSVPVTLWSETAVEFDGSSCPIIAIKGAVVNDFNGISLSVGRSSNLAVNPDIAEAHKLKGWWESTGNAKTDFSSLQTMSGGFSGTKTLTFEEAKRAGLGMGDKTDYYANKATLLMIRKENMLYKSCPSETCMKKVTDMDNGKFRCEKCNEQFDSFKWRIIAAASLGDCTGDLWANMFMDVAESVLGITAQELGDIKQLDDAKFEAIIAKANFSEFTYKLRCKTETYKDENRLKTFMFTAEPLNPVVYSKQLLSQIKDMMAV